MADGPAEAARPVKLEASWATLLEDQFRAPYMVKLREFLLAEKRKHKRIYPAGENIFAALNLTPVSATKVVIIGQDPYHGEGQAHGLSFSVPPGVAQPPSLVNIFKEINDDLGSVGQQAGSESGCLTGWSRQGVLLLNAVLTVEHSQAGAHQGRGWEQFTDTVVARLSAQGNGIVFMLWGNYALKKGQVVDRSRHLVLTAPHPSPLSAYRGFLGCGHFSKANAYLTRHGKQPIDWFASE